MIRPYFSIKHLVLASLLWLTATAVVAQTLTATVDRTQLGKGETLELRIKYDGQTTGEPDFSPLRIDFEVLSQSQKNHFSILNGRTVSHTEWRIQLLPRATGSLTIPPLNFKGVSSKAIQLKVEDRPQGSSNQPVFVETELNKNVAYVQEQLLLTFRINASTGLQSIASEDLMIKDASVVKVFENQYQKKINGVNHLVVELKYAVFPENSGELTIPSLRFNAVIPDRRDPYSNSFFSRGGKRVFLYSEEKKITIKPKPAVYGAGEWLPTTAVSLSERWSRPLDELVAGEPITRTIHISAQGLTAAQLPPLEVKAGQEFKLYPEQPQLDNDVTHDGVIGTRSESVALIASQGGNIELPAITVKWWDTSSDQMRETVLAAKTLSVKPAETSILGTEPETEISTATERPENTTQAPSPLSRLLIASNVILLSLVIILLILLWKSSKNPKITVDEKQNTVEPDEAELFRQLKQQAKHSNLSAFREVLLRWASAFWHHPQITLEEIAIKAGEPTLTDELKSLDQLLYSPDTANKVEPTLIVKALQQVRGQHKAEKPEKGNHLQPLYSNS